MSPARFLRIVRQRLRAVSRQETMDAELRRELAFHADLLAHELEADGLPPAEARRAARKSLGNLPLLEEQCRDHRRVRAFHDLRQDVIYGLRMLRKSPGFTCVAVASLALGIGANTAILGVMDAVLRGRLAIPNDDRIVVARTYPDENPGQETHASLAEYFAWRDGNRSFDLMSASIGNQADFGAEAGGPHAERVQGQAATAELFRILGVQPALGRVFTEVEDRVGAPDRVIVISHRLWRLRFGEAADVLDREIRLNAVTARVIGVMPEGFHYPSAVVDYWIPLRPDRSQVFSPERFFVVTARLKDGVTADQARSDLSAIAAQLAREMPQRHAAWSVRVKPLREAMFGWTREPLFTLAGAVALVMLVACANVAGLLLARGVARRPEIAVRAALGAARERIVRQLLTESVLLSLAGGVLGVAVAWAGVHALVAMSPPPGGVRIADTGFDPRLLALTALISIATVLVFGVAPAFIGSRADITGALDRSARRTRPHPPPRLRGALVAAQIAVTVVLLIGSALLLKSFVRLSTRDLHFDPGGLLTFELHFPIATYLRPIGSTDGLPYFEIGPRPSLTMQRVSDGLRQLPGAEAVAVISYPLVNSIVLPTMTVALEPGWREPEGRRDVASRSPGDRRPTGDAASQSPAMGIGSLAEYVAGRDGLSAAYFLVTPRFFSTIRATLVRGRDVDERDTSSSPWVAIVNESTARRFWPGEDPIGRRFTLRAVSDERPREVIGVVRDIPLTGLQTDPRPVIYTSYLQQPARFRLPGANMFGRMTFMVRSTGDATRLVPSVRRVVAEVDPDRPLSNVATMEQQLGGMALQRATYVLVLGLFALTAMVLAAIGIYGVLAYSVSRRTREIGVRIALGAGTRDVVTMVLGNVLLIVSAGLIVGLAGAVALSGLLTSQLWGVTPTDPATFLGAMALLVLVALLACALPVRRATTVNPTVALRCE